MDSEFITSRGKVIVSNSRLLIQILKADIRQTLFGEITIPLVVLTLIFASFFNPSKAFGHLATAIFILLFFYSHIKQLYIAVFRKSYSDYISLNRIKSFELRPDEFGLETEVRLHLKNNRYRSLIFRTLEKQYEPFIELLTQYIAHPELA